MARASAAKVIGIAALTTLLAAATYVAWAALAPVPQRIISTFAGGGAGDGKNAQLASVGAPADVVTDTAGNFYVVDQQHSRIRKVDAAGIITTIAGIGIDGYSGDGGPAIAAMLNGPTGIDVDAAGNLYIAESANERVRKIDTNGIITTVAGNGILAFSGDGGPAASAQLASPTKLAIAANGVLYIADTGNNRIRKIDANGIITTIAGTGTAAYGGDAGAASAAQLNSPRGLAFDTSGNLYIADYSNQRIRKIDSAGIITTIAGNGTPGYSGDGGAATAAQLNYPQDIGFDSHDNLYIADSYNQRIRKVDASGKITTVAGGQSGHGDGDGGPATAAHFLYPQGLGIDPNGVLYIADATDNKVRRVDTAGIITTAVGNGWLTCCDGDPATTAALNLPVGLSVDAGGSVYIADSIDNQIRKVDGNGIITTVAGTGSSNFFGDGRLATSAGLFSPQGVAVDAAGVVYIADTGDQRVRKIGTDGIITTIAGTGSFGYSGDGKAAVAAVLGTPSDVALDGSGNLYIVDTRNHAIRKVDAAGIITTVAGNGTAGLAGDGGPAAQAQLDTPRSMAVDAGTGNLYIADTNNHRIRKIDANGIISTVAGTSSGFAGDNGPATAAKLNSPYGVAIDDDGNLYIADTYNNRIRKVDANGIITTVAGASAGFAGDGGPATAARLDFPVRIAIDAHGNVFVSDQSNNRIRVLGASHTISGTVSGLAGGGLVLSLNNGAEALPVSANGDFTFTTALANGAGYAVSVQTQPLLPTQLCSVADGTGTVAGADVTNVTVSCVTTAITHKVTALAGPGGTISPNGTQTVADGLVLTFNVTPDTGYVVAGVTGCGAALAKATYTTAPVTADCTVNATFTLVNNPVNGVCGNDNGKTLLTPPVNLCSAGTPSTVQGSGPWTWTCQGSNGGSAASCAAQKATAPSATVTTLSLTPNPANVGQNVVATVGVSESASNVQSIARPAAVVGGTVTISGGSKNCSAALSNGSASCALIFDAPGTYALVANYSGDSNHAPSSDTRTLTINAIGSGRALVTAPALDRWALVITLLSLLAIAVRRYRRA